MVYSNTERAFILEHYFRHTSYEKVRELFVETFPNRVVPNKSTIQRIVTRFQTAHTVDSGYTGRKRTPTTLTPEKKQEIEQRITAQPTLSTRRLGSQVNVSTRSVCRCLKSLKLHPYKISVMQELLATDYTKRVRYCRWLLNFVNENGQDVFDRVYFSDEAWFHLSGYVNSQNNRYWSSENPNQFEETSLHPQKIGVWCAMSRKKIIGPIFFSGTINSAAYQEIITQFISLLDADERHIWFQQDGARAYTSADTLNFLRTFFFGEKLISVDW